MVHLQKFVFNLFQENCYVIWDEGRQAVIIDPGAGKASEKEALYRFIGEKGLDVRAVWLTHGHPDHIYGVRGCHERYGCPVYMNPEESMVIRNFNEYFGRIGINTPEEFDSLPVAEGDLLRAGDICAKVIGTPGHSRGGVCYLLEDEKMLFTGDTLFAGSIGRTDNEWASLDELLASIRGKLMTLDGGTDIFPGHGPGSCIAVERTTNPFIFEDFSFQDFADEGKRD